MTGIPYSIGEAKALAKSYPDQYVREMLDWLIEKAERPSPPRRYFRFGHARTSGFIRLVHGPVMLVETRVKSESFGDVKRVSELTCCESLRALTSLYAQSPQMQSVWRNGPSRWMNEWVAIDEIEKFKK